MVSNILWNEVYRNGKRNSAIAASESEYFGTSQTDLERKQKQGSFNKLSVLSQASTAYRITLDDDTTRQWDIPSTSAFSIDPAEGLFFNTVKITDLSGLGISADKISVNWAIAEVIR